MGEEGVHSQGRTQAARLQSHRPDRHVRTRKHMHTCLYIQGTLRRAHTRAHTGDPAAASDPLGLRAPELFLTHQTDQYLLLPPTPPPELLHSHVSCSRGQALEAPALRQPRPLGHKGQNTPFPLCAMWGPLECHRAGTGRQKPGRGGGAHALSLLLSHGTKEAEAQRGQVACPRRHSQYISGLQLLFIKPSGPNCRCPLSPCPS